MSVKVIKVSERTHEKLIELAGSRHVSIGKIVQDLVDDVPPPGEKVIDQMHMRFDALEDQLQKMKEAGL